MCVCDLRVFVRNRDEEDGFTIDPQILEFVGSNRSTQNPYAGFSIMGLPWHPPADRLQRMVLCLGSRRSREEPALSSGPRTANRNNMAAFNCGIYTVVNERFVLHDRRSDAPTLSPECS